AWPVCAYELPHFLAEGKLIVGEREVHLLHAARAVSDNSQFGKLRDLALRQPRQAGQDLLVVLAQGWARPAHACRSSGQLEGKPDIRERTGIWMVDRHEEFARRQVRIGEQIRIGEYGPSRYTDPLQLQHRLVRGSDRGPRRYPAVDLFRARL